MNKKPKIIFMGTPEFAVPALISIHDKYGIEAVVTVPDKPKGRGLKMAYSPVKNKALELGIPVLQPEKLKDEQFIENLKSYEPDIIVVIAFRILPKDVYLLPQIASFNIHGSLLPKFRGAAPINHAIIKGEKKTGLTSFILGEKVDTGNMLLQYECNIDDNMTAGELHDLLMPEAAILSLKTIELLINGNYLPIIQDESCASPAPKIFRENCKINWVDSQHNIHNLIRGLSPYPSSWTTFEDKQFKILRTLKAKQKIDPGKFTIKDNKMLVGTSDFALEILEIQPENKKPMLIKEFLNGWRGLEDGFFK
jgi:methionyl-tRNA formyltransferase